MEFMKKMTYLNRRKIGLLCIGIGLVLQVFGPKHNDLIDFFRGLLLGVGIILVLWKIEGKKKSVSI